MTKKYWGLQTTYPSGFSAQWTQLVADAGKVPSLGHVGTQQWTSGASFSAIQAQCDAIRAVGAHPALDWFTSLSGSPLAAYCNPAIIAGGKDAYLTTWAQQVAAWGKPLLVFFCSEMNGGWYPAFSDWATGSGNSAGSFKNMWNKVTGIFDANGATNVTWALVFNIQSPDGSGQSTSETSQPMSQFFSATRKPDLMGLDGFNYGGGSSGGMSGASGNNWYSFDQCFDIAPFGASYTHLCALDATIPTCLGSWGCASTDGKDTNASWATQPHLVGAKKAAWLDTMATMLAGKYSRVAVWRHYDLDHQSIPPPYTYGYSLRDNDSAFQTPTAAATGGAHVSDDSGLTVTYTVTGAGAPLTAFRNMVSGPDHLAGNVATLQASGKLVLPFVDPVTDTYEAAELAAGGILAEFRLGEASKIATAVAFETSGHGLNGVYVGANCVDVAGLIATSTNRALRIDGTSFVRVPTNVLFSPSAAPIWISCWYQIAALPATTMILACKGGGDGTSVVGNKWEYDVGLTATGIRGIIYNLSGTNAIGITASLVPALNVRHRLDFAFDPTLADGTTDKAILYHDGLRISGATTVSGVITPNDQPLIIGRRGAADYPFGTVANPGIIDEVRIRGTFPTAQNVLDLWYAGSGIVAPTPSTSKMLAVD